MTKHEPNPFNKLIGNPHNPRTERAHFLTAYRNWKHKYPTLIKFSHLTRAPGQTSKTRCGVKDKIIYFYKEDFEIAWEVIEKKYLSETGIKKGYAFSHFVNILGYSRKLAFQLPSHICLETGNIRRIFDFIKKDMLERNELNCTHSDIKKECWFCHRKIILGTKNYDIVFNLE